MKKLDALQKCIIGNQVLSIVNKEELIAGERVTITIDTKKSGEIKNISIKKGEE